MVFVALRGRSHCAPSPTSSRSPEQDSSTRHGSSSRRCSPTPTTSASTPRRSPSPASRSATSRKPSPTCPSSTRRSRWTESSTYGPAPCALVRRSTMADQTAAAATQKSSGNTRLGVLLSMAMFVLVVDTSLMNVSISAVVADLNTTVSGVQSAIAIEALVSAAFILISSKVGDLIGRKKAYILGLIAYGIGALAMTLAQNLATIIVFWALTGGLGASLLLPAMQSLIHGNFEGKAQKKTYALVGAAA